LQTLAETFECWLDIEYAINGPKKVRFKRYIGQQNDVGFRYGVNLKDISRTVDSKAMVTKLIVKPNSNEFAPSGFCTIARAKANPIQDTVLFDFSSYFHNG
jgi:phage minor structural protein